MTRKRDWLPTLWSDWGEDEESPFYALRKQIDALMEDFDHGDLKRDLMRGAFLVRTNVSETNTEVRLTAELPGLEKGDVDVEITGDTITISGDKTDETEDAKKDEGRNFRRVERRSGSFRRTVRLPFEIDPDSVNADIRNGVLTVTVPKPEGTTTPARKVEVKSAA